MENKERNITPEEAVILWHVSRLDLSEDYEQAPEILKVRGSVIGTLGNFSASIGKAKSKKTFNVSAIVAAALKNGTVLNYTAELPENKRKKLMFTIFVLLLYRVGSAITVPFVDTSAMAQYYDANLSNTILGLYNAMSGSAFAQASVLALGIQPYINSSIIIQLQSGDGHSQELNEGKQRKGWAHTVPLKRRTLHTSSGLSF